MQQDKPKRGRPSTGTLGVVSIRMPDENWSDADALIARGEYGSRSEFFAVASELLVKKHKERTASVDRVMRNLK